MKRTEILEKLIEEQNKIITGLEETVANYRTASDLDEDAPRDAEDLSHQDEAKDMQLRYENLLADATQNRTFLESVKEATQSEIGSGSVVETDKNYLFVGISVPVFEIGGKKVISFSEEAPVFSEINGKTTGDSIKIGDEKQVIKAVY